MNKLLISGYEKIEKDFGYWPSFHDDIIEKIEITKEEITFFINIQAPPQGLKFYPVIKLMFIGIERFNLEGELYGCVSIILDMESEKIENYIETQILSSLGTYGTIRSSEIKIEKDE
jgi:hypothetical protein